MKNALSLKKSFFLTIVIASAFLILVFTHLQITREAQRTAEHQIRETHLSLLLTKEVLESQLKMGGSHVESAIINSIANLTHNMGGSQQLLLLSRKGKVLFPSNHVNQNASIDQKRTKEILLTYDLTGQWFKPLPTPNRSDALDIFTPIFSNQEVAYFLKTTVTLDNLKNAFFRTYRFVILIFLMVIVFALVLAIRVKHKIIDPIRKLADHTSEIAKGNLDRKVVIDTGDEIEDLARSFNDMAKQLLIMKNKAEDSNPLTHLPGNRVITAEIEKRLKTGGKFAAMYCDIDRFKIYNDLYGIQRGDEVIQSTAAVLREAVENKGGAGDLVAHEGGDDFMIVTVPQRMSGIAEEIIKLFDVRKERHYRGVDTKRGHIFIKDRRAKDPDHAPLVPIPLMSISIAALTNEKHAYASYLQITNDLAIVKKKAKRMQGSSFVVKE